MANAFYSKGLENFLDGKISWAEDAIRAVLIDTTQYRPVFDAHSTMADIPAAARIAISPTLTGKTSSLGVANADPLTFPVVNQLTPGQQAGGLAIFKDSLSEGTSYLICWIDSAQAGLPITPGGGPITIVWDSNSPIKIFKL